MFRQLFGSTAAALLLSATIVPAAVSLVSANVTIAASAGASGTTTLSYRATVTRAGTVRDIVVSVPAGSTGQITSINGTVSTVSPGVLRWRPSNTVVVAVGARFSIPLYGLRLPSGGPWSLAFKATGTTGAILSSGNGTLALPANVLILASNPIPGQKTTLTYAGTLARAGVLAAVRMQLPAGASGAVTSINGTLTTSGGYATWKPRTPISVGAGARLSIPIYGVVLSKYGGILTLAMSASASTGVSLMSGSATLALIAPPAAMPPVPVNAMPSVRLGCPSSWPSTVVENVRPGTADWVIPSSMNGALAAYLTQTSATCGDVVDIKVTSGNPVSIVAYRMGYYQGLGAREIWRQDGVPTVVQAAPTTGGTANGNSLRMTSAAHWTTTASIPVNATWVPGVYLIKVSGGGAAAYAPLTIRDDSGTKHDLLIQQATTTWEAYNTYGGIGFYSGGVTGGSGRLSSDRPYAEGQGSGQFLPLEQGLVFWAESKGLDVTYWTNHDLDEYGGQLPDRAGTVFLPAHDEYFSLPMRAALSQAINSGVNVANLGANTAYRRITFTNDSRRTWDIDRYADGYNSTTWRYLGDGYASQPLLGAEYVCAVLASTLTTGTSWVFDGVAPGTALPGFVAGEIDYAQPGLYQHPGQTTAASSTGTCRTSGKAAPMHMTTYTAPSGARVLNGSTFAFACFLVARCPSNWTVPTPSPASQLAVGKIVANIAEWVSHGQIAVPADTTIAQVRAAVPKQKLEVHTQP
ncbi:N,N-dimethylformamidase beta subunit family domain-containing protein [Kribbella catacumbae]|uniref:N,N-dimethylformamidase beta subunit family domain-containing protein n=1 Tax=Kribbella catacumbae TaxID=460086 RepID=UPI0003755B9E|nr:N,N-dimethylformamidase beta subunit family domain-containing protein [Kribbella catacumbae]